MIVGGLHGLTLTEAAVAVGALGYIVSLARDWRPLRSLRAENRDLRKMLEQAEKKIEMLQSQVETLQKATDLSALVDEHQKIAHVLERVIDKLESLDRAVQAKASAIESLARWAALKQNLDEMEGKP